MIVSIGSDELAVRIPLVAVRLVVKRSVVHSRAGILYGKAKEPFRLPVFIVDLKCRFLLPIRSAIHDACRSPSRRPARKPSLASRLTIIPRSDRPRLSAPPRPLLLSLLQRAALAESEFLSGALRVGGVIASVPTEEPFKQEAAQTRARANGASLAWLPTRWAARPGGGTLRALPHATRP